MIFAFLLATAAAAADPKFAPDQSKLPAVPPKGATVLLDEKGKHSFLSMAGGKTDWPVVDGVMTSTSNKRNQNHVVSALHFKDADIHVEFMLPEKGPGNSGVYIHGHYEVQIFNSFGKAKVTQDDAGAVYGFSPPSENACRKPGEWQVFDIRYRAPRRDDSGKITENGTVTVWYNGKKVQDGAAFGEPKSVFHPFRYGNTPYLNAIRDRQKKTMTGPVFLQDHGNPVKFRNVWVVPADDKAFTYEPPPPAKERKPNFVFVYADDHRWDAMGVVQKEQGKQGRFPWFRSPSMDRLAAGGVRFRNAFVTLSLCAPSRAAFLTGRYNHANGITNNSRPFPEKAVTHATQLRAAGYKTAYVGKWHMGNQKGPRPGFDYSAGFVGQGRYVDCPFEIDGKVTPTKGRVDAVSTEYAVAWMKENRDKPFSLVLGLKSPHGPRNGNGMSDRLRKLYAGETSRPTPNCGVPAIWHTKDPKTDKYPLGLADNDTHLEYLRHIAEVDDNLGRLLDALDELKLADDTVVVYSSDNGFFLGEHNSGDKRALYEESIRIPMLARYPRLFGKGTTVDEMVLNIDLAPTFLDLAGVPIPKEMQGASWKDLAAGKKPAGWRKSFLAQYYKELGNVPTCYGVRTATQKLVVYPGRPEWTEVFDLAADPYEIKNLAGDAKRRKELENEAARLIKEVGYTVPTVPPAKEASDPKKGAGANAEPASGAAELRGEK